MTATKYTESERAIKFALRSAGLLVVVIGFLDLISRVLDIPVLTLWKTGAYPMSPAFAVLSVLFGAALFLRARLPQGLQALFLITIFGVVGSTTALLLLVLRFLGVYLLAEHPGLSITGIFGNAPIGYILLIPAFCLLLSFGSLLASLPHGARAYWRGWLMWGSAGLVSFVGFVLLLTYVFGIPLLFGKAMTPTSLSTSFSLMIIGLAQLALAARYTGRPAASANVVRPIPYILVFVVLVAGTFLVAYYFYRETEQRFLKAGESQLLSVSELKTDDLVRWRMDCFEDGILYQNKAFTAGVRQLLESPNSTASQRDMQELLGRYEDDIGYDRASFLDSNGITRMSVPYSAEPTAGIIVERAAVALRMGKMVLQDFYRDEHDQHVYLALIVPILDRQDGNRPLGVVVLRIDPSMYLYPHIKRWPVPSTSAETLLVRRENNDVLFLNDLRFLTNAALSLRKPLISNTELPAAKAVLGASGIVEGLDYRGEQVFAAVRAVPDSPWYIVARMDTAEVYAPLRERMWLTLLLVSVLVCGAGVVLILLWRQQRMEFYRKQFELTAALRDSEEWHQSILRTAMDGFWQMDVQGHLLEVNEAFCRMSGYSEEELLSVNMAELKAFESAEDFAAHIQNTITHGRNRFECRHRRKDGSSFETEVSIQYLPFKDGRFVAFLHDISERKQAAEELQISALKYQTLFESSRDALMILMPPSWRFIGANPATLQLFGASSQADFIALGPLDISPDRQPDGSLSSEKAQEIIAIALREGSHFFEWEHQRLDGQTFTADVLLTRMDSAGKQFLQATVRDITERKQAQEKLHLAASVFTYAREGVMITTTDGTIIEVNDAFCDISGYSREEILGQNPRLFKSSRQAAEFYVDMWRDLVEQGSWQGELWNRRKNGEVHAVMPTISAVRDEQGNTRHYVALYTDITRLKDHEQKLERSAHFDMLTNLPNRVLLADRLQQGMVQIRRREQRLAVAFLDLDGFKAINDNYGHETGDQLLIALSARMKQVLREGDTLARLGGDEFVAVLVDIGDIDASVPMLTRLLIAAAEPVKLGEIIIQVSASLGVTFYPQTEEIDAEQLLRQADQAMYQAKQAGKNRYHLFDAEQDCRARSRYETIERIRRALNANEFVLYYQPKVNMRTGTVIGVEALIRWQHPEQGLLLPDVFLPEIEDHPLAIELGTWVIKTALLQIESWRAVGLNLPVSINIGPRHLYQPDFVARLQEMLAAHPNVGPGDLELEVLEANAMNELFKVSEVIDSCRKLGVGFALDDFGTGYSSLNYLKHLPVNHLKIDQTFVRDMIEDPDDLSIVEGAIAIASAFRLMIIAEGAETVEHGTILLQLGCDQVQGYAIARPMPASQLPAWKATWRPDPAWSEKLSFCDSDLQLLIASIEHRAWIKAMENFLKDEREAPLPLDIHQCRFGHWLDTDGRARFGALPDFQAIDQLHRQVHALAAELYKLQVQGHRKEALARLGELFDLRDALLEQLTLAQQLKQ